MSSLRLRLFITAGAGIWSRGSILILRLVQVPFFISHLGLEGYGKWLFLYSIPSWLSLSSLGFGSVASNEMSLRFKKEDPDRANEVYSSTTLMLLVSGTSVAIFAALVALIIPSEWMEAMNLSSRYELMILLLSFCCYTTLSFLGELQIGKLRTHHKTHIAMVVYSFRPWLELLALAIGFLFSVSFMNMAIWLALSQVLYLGIFIIVSQRLASSVRFAPSNVKFDLMRQIFRKGMAFQSIPLGNALLFQGSILIVQLTLGPLSVAIYSTVRTLVRTVNQALEVINQSILPEMTHLLAAKDLKRACTLHRSAVWLSIIVGGFGTILMAVMGPSAYEIWIGQTTDLSWSMLIAFLIPIPITSVWFSSSAVLLACNDIEGMAVRYLVGSVLTLVSCGLLSYCFGLQGVAISSLWLDLILLHFVLTRSLQLTGDSIRGLIMAPTSALQLLRAKVIRFGSR